MRTRHVPQRTCVACRQTRAKRELLRIVKTPLGKVQVDPSGKLAGRGAYLCRQETCLGQAVKQKRLGRALGLPVGSDLAEEIRRHLGGEPVQPQVGD